MRPYYAENMTYEEFLKVPAGMQIFQRTKEEKQRIDGFRKRKADEDEKFSGKCLFARIDALMGEVEKLNRRVTDLEFKENERAKSSSYLRSG